MYKILKLVNNLTHVQLRKQLTLLSSIKVIQKYKNYHTSHQLYIKMFKEHENRYAYSILVNKGYANSLNSDIDIQDRPLSWQSFEKLLQEDWSKKSPQELYAIFPQLGEYCGKNNLCISNNMFDNYIDFLADSVKLASDEELELLFYALNKWPDPPSIRTRNFIEIWAALDDACLNRIRNLTFDQMLSFTALFYMLSVVRVSDFSTKSLQKLTSKAKQLTPGQTVQTLFFIGVLRKQPFDMHNFELHLINNFSEFSIDEVAIMSMGFFKSKTPIRSMELISKIIELIKINAKDVHEVALAALLKIIRYSTKMTVDDGLYQLMDKLQYEVPRLSVMCNVHLAILGTSTLTLHRSCINKIADSVLKKISYTRLKDLERLVLTYATFNLKPDTKECFFSKVIEELRNPEREEEIALYGRSFSCCISYLSILGIYPTDLINKALSSEFLEKTYGNQIYHYGKEILALNNTAEIFCSPSEVSYLHQKTIQILAKKYTDFVPTIEYPKNHNITEKMVLDVMKVLQNSRGGDDYVIGDHILSHHQRGDIIICNDLNGNPVKVKTAFSKQTFGLLRRPPDNNNWIVLVIAGRNAIIYGTDTPTGQFQVKVKELEALGYHAVLVPWSIYSKLDVVDAKEDYLCSLINKALES